MMASAFLAIPTYNDSVHVGTMMGVVTASAMHHYQIAIHGSSLLAHGFNRLWVNGVNSGCDYFAMCHADVGPQSGWLDILIDELESHQADLVSAVVPVKTAEAVFSTAIAECGQVPDCRLTVADLSALPATFDTSDVQRVTGRVGNLLVNTGLWVARLGKEWNRQVEFRVQTWIDWESGHPVVMPEDWDFCDQLHTLGCRVMATQKVRLLHAGITTWRADGSA